MTKKIYFDYAATTPIDHEVLRAMKPYFSTKFGNPSSLHSFGQEAIGAVDESREKIATSINADFHEIIFTGSATEANNLALRGIVKAVRLFSDGTVCSPTPAVGDSLNSRRGDSAYGGDQARHASETFRTKTTEPLKRIIISKIEHESILETCRDLEREGVEIIYLPVNRSGFVDLKKLKESLNERTILVSIMYANNEIGIIKPITEISNIIQQFKKERNLASKKSVSEPERAWFDPPAGGERARARAKGRASGWASETPSFREARLSEIYPLFHTDAVQAFQFLDCNVTKLGVDLMTLSAHKIYGPKGIGLLYVKNQLINPIITGGGQEFGLRSGTENVPAVVGFAKAVELTVKNREKETKRITELTNYFWKEIKKIKPRTKLNGIMNNELGIRNKQKLPNILNVYFPNPVRNNISNGASQNSQDLLMKLDLAGIAVSSGSACSTRSTQPSHVLKAIGLNEKRIKESLRFSFGKFTTKKEINNAIKIIKKI